MDSKATSETETQNEASTASETETQSETSTVSETEIQDEMSTANQTVTANEPGQSILTPDQALRMLEDVLGESPSEDEPETLVKLLLFLSDNFDHPGLKATIQTLVQAAFDNSLIRDITFEEYVEAIREGRNPLKLLKATVLQMMQGELLDETGAIGLTDVVADGPKITALNVKWTGIARLFLKGPATLTVQEIRDGIGESIEEAVADKAVQALALLLRWFVAESGDTTIEHFKGWMEAAESMVKQEPPSNGRENHDG